MDVDTIKTIGGIVETQGFSIIACLGLAWYSWRLTNRYADDAKAREEKMGAQIRDLTMRIRKLEDQRADDATRHASSQERIVRSLSRLVRGRPCMANITSESIRDLAEHEPHDVRRSKEETEEIRRGYDHG
jgi:hypothetical protein